MKKQLLLFICLFFTALAFAQTSEHYVVKNDGDTLHGTLKYKGSEGDIKNKITVKVNDTTKITLKASEVKYFKDGKEEFITFNPEDEEGIFFLRIWVKGYYELYEWQVPTDLSSSSKTEYIAYIKKRGSKNMVEIDHKYWKGQLAEMMDDNEQLSKDIEKGKYHMDEMGAAVKDYNDWKEGDKDDGGDDD